MDRATLARLRQTPDEPSDRGVMHKADQLFAMQSLSRLGK